MRQLSRWKITERGRLTGWARLGPGCQNLVRLHDLFWRTGKIVPEFSGPVGDMNLDGVQSAVFHSQAELLVDFPDGVLLEAVAHTQASAHGGQIAMLIDDWFSILDAGSPSVRSTSRADVLNRL